MKVHHIRNATMVIEFGDKVLLIDPMLGDVGTAAPPFSFIRFKPRKNPTVPLPSGIDTLLNSVTHCLITHRHADHLDKAALTFLRERQIPITCSEFDKEELVKEELNLVETLSYWEPIEFLGGTITGIPARHGYGFVAKPMGKVMGYYIELPNEPSLYLSSDTILTSDVVKTLKEKQPDISVVACGTAQLDLFQPLLMKEEDILKFVDLAPHKVICNHMEAVNHCPTTRKRLREILNNNDLLDKCWIPDDGEQKTF